MRPPICALGLVAVWSSGKRKNVLPIVARLFSFRRCQARRVFGSKKDEWVSGQSIICHLCKEKREELKLELEELEDPDDRKAKEEEIAAAKYTYRSYNKKSLELYAERFPWCDLPPSRP